MRAIFATLVGLLDVGDEAHAARIAFQDERSWTGEHVGRFALLEREDGQCRGSSRIAAADGRRDASCQ